MVTLQEPTNIKELIKALIDKGIEPSYAIWFGNKLARFLWSSYGEVFKRNGLRWQDFLRYLSSFEQQILMWIYGETQWSELLKSLEKALSEQRSEPTGLEKWFKKFKTSPGSI